ncbi:hypothetical protein Tco_0212100 [Tanacetum coccineum]
MEVDREDDHEIEDELEIKCSHEAKVGELMNLEDLLVDMYSSEISSAVSEECKKDKNRVFVVNLKHDGIYSPYPFPYIHGDEKQLTDFDFEVRKTLKQGLCPLGNDPDVQEFLKAGYKDEHFDPNPESEPELYLNRTDSRNNGNFRGFINEHIPVNEDLNIEDLDSSSLEPRHQIQRGIASPRHDPLQPWNEMQPILGMRYDHLDNMKHEYMEQILIEEEEKRIAAEKAIQEEFDEEAVRLTLEEEARYEKEYQDKIREDEESEYIQMCYNHGITPEKSTSTKEACGTAYVQTQESIVDSGEPGWRLTEDAPTAEQSVSAQPSVAATETTPKGKTIEADAAEPPKLKKQGRKRKVAEPSAAEPPFRIYHKSRGRSERIFNQKMKKTGFGPNGEGSTSDKAGRRPMLLACRVSLGPAKAFVNGSARFSSV